MLATNLNRLLKTVKVGTVKLPTPADRIGSGFNATFDTDLYPASVLSRGQFPMPRLPEPESEPGSRVVPSTGTPTGPRGSFPGTTARRTVSTRVQALTGLPALPPPVATPTSSAKPAGVEGAATTSRARHPGSHERLCSVERDCQSPDRRTVRVTQAVTARQRGWRRTARPIPAAGK